MNPRHIVKDEGADFAQRAFDKGVNAVLAVVFGNEPMGVFGIQSGVAGVTEEDMEAIRWLRQRVHGRKAYDYKPDRKRPTRNALRGLRHYNRATDERTP